MTIAQLLQNTIDRQASDLHLVVGYTPKLRINGELTNIEGEPPVSTTLLEESLNYTLNDHQKQLLTKNLSLDLGFDFEKKARFRINYYRQNDTWAAAFRLIPSIIPSLSETNLPEVVSRLTQLKQGLVLITGPTGQGKSTTMASFINTINQTEARNIITIEDPVEYTYPKSHSLISQRELAKDTLSWNEALRDSLREDPDVILLGEVRDLETISSALTVAETGHLIFTTLHTNSAAQSIDRIVDVFSEQQQPQVRTQLAAVIEAIISIRLIPTIQPGRILAAEVSFGTNALRAIIRENKTHLIDNLIQTSAEFGMRLLETSLAEMVADGTITSEVALRHAIRPELLLKLLKLSR